MRYKDFSQFSASSEGMQPANTILLRLRKPEHSERLEKLIMAGDVRLHGEFRTLPGIGRCVDVTCRDGDIALALLIGW